MLGSTGLFGIGDSLMCILVSDIEALPAKQLAKMRNSLVLHSVDKYAVFKVRMVFVRR
jgi:hypothetical protein